MKFLSFFQYLLNSITKLSIITENNMWWNDDCKSNNLGWFICLVIASFHISERLYITVKGLNPGESMLWFE